MVNMPGLVGHDGLGGWGPVVLYSAWTHGDKSCGWGRFLRRGCVIAALLGLRGEGTQPGRYLMDADLRVS